jgi:hypothetical protein
MQLGGNRTGRGSALTKYYKGGKMTAAEMAHVKNFFRLPKEATKEQVSFVAAAVTFQAARDKRAGASRRNEAATPAVAKKNASALLVLCKVHPLPRTVRGGSLRRNNNGVLALRWYHYRWTAKVAVVPLQCSGTITGGLPRWLVRQWETDITPWD